MLKRSERNHWLKAVSSVQRAATFQPLDADDLQRFAVALPPGALRCFFLSFRQDVQARAWLTGLVSRVQAAGAARSGWSATFAFTWNGLQALGVDDASLVTFPFEFRQGMPARAGVLGDAEAGHPAHWVGGLARHDLHAMFIVAAADIAERTRAVREYDAYATRFGEVRILSTLDLEMPSLSAELQDHFGQYHRREPAAAGSPELAGVPPQRPPSALSRNGTFLAYRRLEQHVGEFRALVRKRRRPPVWSRACPSLTLRHVVPYGPPLSEGAPEDGLERGIVTFDACLSLDRQFEFTMPGFLSEPKSPLRAGRTAKARRGLASLTTLRGGAYFFLPGLEALRYLTSVEGNREQQVGEFRAARRG